MFGAREGATFGPLLVLGLLLAGALGAIAVWGRNIGIAEDWTMVPAMVGREPDLLEWLWSQNNEHRLPVQRLIYLGLLRVTGDFRSGMVANALLLATLAAILIAASAQARGGRVAMADALFPLALLHLGHWENIVWGWQLQFVWSVVLAGLLLAIVIASRERLDRRRGAAAICILLLLPLSGANGIVIGLSMAIWLAAQGAAWAGPGPASGFGAGYRASISHWLAPPGVRFAPGRAVWMAAGAAGCAAAVGLYFIGYVSPAWAPPLANREQFVRAAETYFGYAFGPAARGAPTIAAVLAALIMATGCAMAAWRALTGPADERLRAGGLAIFIAAGIALGLAVSLARGAYPYRMPDRYALLAVMPLLGAAIALRLYDPGLLRGRAQTLLALAFLLLLPLNVRTGFEWRDWYVSGMSAVEADLAAGVGAEAMAECHFKFLMHWDKDALAAAILMLEEAGIGPFAGRPLHFPENSARGAPSECRANDS